MGTALYVLIRVRNALTKSTISTTTPPSTCSDGSCGECSFAPANNFITTRAIEGWELTGGWALYREGVPIERARSIVAEVRRVQQRMRGAG